MQLAAFDSEECGCSTQCSAEERATLRLTSGERTGSAPGSEVPIMFPAYRWWYSGVSERARPERCSLKAPAAKHGPPRCLRCNWLPCSGGTLREWERTFLDAWTLSSVGWTSEHTTAPAPCKGVCALQPRNSLLPIGASPVSQVDLGVDGCETQNLPVENASMWKRHASMALREGVGFSGSCTFRRPFAARWKWHASSTSRVGVGSGNPSMVVRLNVRLAFCPCSVSRVCD